MGEFILKGENALDLLQRVTTNDVSKLTAARLNIVVLPMKPAALLMICWFIALKIIRCT
jgi:Glycine cleavage system T protein (aminomethyltransferase)